MLLLLLLLFFLFLLALVALLAARKPRVGMRPQQRQQCAEHALLHADVPLDPGASERLGGEHLEVLRHECGRPGQQQAQKRPGTLADQRGIHTKHHGAVLVALGPERAPELRRPREFVQVQQRHVGARLDEPVERAERAGGEAPVELLAALVDVRTVPVLGVPLERRPVVAATDHLQRRRDERERGGRRAREQQRTQLLHQHTQQVVHRDAVRGARVPRHTVVPERAAEPGDGPAAVVREDRPEAGDRLDVRRRKQLLTHRRRAAPRPRRREQLGMDLERQHPQPLRRREREAREQVHPARHHEHQRVAALLVG